jgi:hypothetical protein
LDYYVPVRSASLEHPAQFASTFCMEFLPLFSSSGHIFVLK